MFFLELTTGFRKGELVALLRNMRNTRASSTCSPPQSPSVCTTLIPSRLSTTRFSNPPDSPTSACTASASLALQNGVDVKAVSSILGHYNAGFTLHTYTHVTTKMQEEAASTMGKLIGANV